MKLLQVTNKRRIVLFLGLILSGVLLTATTLLFPNTTSVDVMLQELEADGFSGAILIAQGNTIHHNVGYGFASCDGEIPNSADTVFAIGSITKMFTATAIGQLDDKERLSLDDPITQYFDSVPDDKTSITIRQLVDHTSGLQTYHETAGLGDFEAMTRDEALNEILSRPLEFAPGDDENYSNSGYTLLALIIEKVSGQPYTDYIREHILDPAGMTATGFWGESFTPIASTPNQVVGCSSPDTWEYSWILVGNGGMLSTTGDLHRWVLALQGDTVLTDQAKQRLGFDQRLQQGFGDAGGSSQHEFNATIEYSGVTKDVIVIAISNRNTVLAEDIAAQQLLPAVLSEL
ncbi:MAG: serine hydrolase domain-containing protein [Chloroflexota bacterium]